MNIRQLETDLRAKQAEARTLMETTMRTCAEEKDRPMTDEEKQAIQAKLDEAKAIKVRLDKASGDAAMVSAIDRLTDGMAFQPSGTGLARVEHRSIGQQVVTNEAWQAFIRNGGHRRNSAWASPAIDCANPFVQRATTLTEDAASGGKLIVPDYQPGIRPLLFKPLSVANLLASGTTDSNAIIYMVETTFTNAAAPVAEGSAKPESALVFDQKTDPVQKIAHWLPVTEEFLEDVPAISGYIDSRLILGVQLAEEDQLLNGNGTPPNLTGIMNRAGLATAVARTTETNAEAILKQITAIATSAFVYPDGVVMNPANWFSTVTMKDSTGQYFGGGPFSAVPAASIWGTPVAVTPSIVANTALVGAFGSMAQIFRKGGVRVEASNSHQDYFVKNLVAIRAEERLALAVYRPGAFGKVTGLN